MADVIEFETGVPFDPSKWIGTHKIYKDVPEEVSDACIAARKMPSAVAAKLSRPTLPVTEFLELKLPSISSTWKKTWTKDWFSKDPPNCDALMLWSLDSIPPLHFVRELDHDFPQQWLNGNRSIRDPLNISLCLPLCTISFFIKIHELLAASLPMDAPLPESPTAHGIGEPVRSELVEPEAAGAAAFVRKRSRKKTSGRAKPDDDSDDSGDSEEERRRRRLTTKKAPAEGVKSRKAPTTAKQRPTEFLNDPHTVKTAPGTLKGTQHEVFCDMRAEDGYQARRSFPSLPSQAQEGHCLDVNSQASTGILGFFQPTIKSKVSTPETAKVAPPPALLGRTKKVTRADKRLETDYFSGSGQWPKRLPAPVLIPDEVECRGLHGDGYREYAWQKGTSDIGGVSPTDWVRLARAAVPYKDRDGANELDGDPDSDVEAEPLPEKTVRAAACTLPDSVELAMNGIEEERNKFTSRTLYTDYEKQRLHQSLSTSARWRTRPNSGAVYARDCRSVTANITGTCSSCTALAKLPGLKRAIWRAREIAQLSRDDFAAHWNRKFFFTPRIWSDNAAAQVKASLANPAAQAGDLEDKESFLVICNQFTDKVRREKDPTGRAMKGIRYSPEMGQLAALMRSHGPRSGTQ
ncbi:hypothetical protein C8R47DRAFT_1216254 [Mycena vitilis]|nr:hypothetical protein C8R47DRAFT_1216254 [Mycena vitilis]